VADGFYEWIRPEDRKQPRVPMHYSLDVGESFAFAGLCTTWRPPDGGEELRSCTILTTTANAVVAPVHDRMPVILSDVELRAAWLDPDISADELLELLRPLDAERLSVRPANPVVNSARHEGPDCLGVPAAPFSDRIAASVARKRRRSSGSSRVPGNFLTARKTGSLSRWVLPWHDRANT
jgi:putative SOS response-associated peptidase YedK